VSRQVIGGSAADNAAAYNDNVLLSILVLVGHCGEVAKGLLCEVARRRLNLCEGRCNESGMPDNSTSQSRVNNKRRNFEQDRFFVRSVASAAGRSLSVSTRQVERT
jgi:hypothetical protein